MLNFRTENNENTNTALKEIRRPFNLTNTVCAISENPHKVDICWIEYNF